MYKPFIDYFPKKSELLEKKLHEQSYVFKVFISLFFVVEYFLTLIVVNVLLQ